MANLTKSEVDIVVVGSCNTDLISYVSRFPKPGETIHGHKFSPGFGGKGANQCVMAARLGARTAMVGKVGDDTFGQDTVKNFKDSNVITDFLGVVKEASTGVAPITVDDSGQNSIVIVSGANMLLTAHDAESALDQMESPKVLVCQLEIQPETTLAALRAAKARGMTTILNPAPGIAELDNTFFEASDILCPNETETEIITGMPVSTVEEAKAASLVLLGKGCKTAIITLGAQGVVFVSKDRESPVHIPVDAVAPVDTTGAGDAFVGSLAFYLARYPSLGLEESLRRACRVAAVSVCSPGTQKSFPRRKDLPDDLF